jgi:homoserine dehydrogenase
MSTLKLGIAGLGTVGAGLIGLLRQNAEVLEQRAGRPMSVVAVSARDPSRDRGLDLAGVDWCDDARELAARDDVDVVVELIGGEDGIALELVEAAIAAGKHVVTANKALLAINGTRLAHAADANGVHVGFEAAVAGGIPIVKALREGLAGNRVERLYGILNGTSNYILTEMRRHGSPFGAVLAEAQALGYAEADPALDVGGGDAAHKLAILASLAFGRPVDFDGVYVEGIEGVTPEDISFAGELGFRVKLLGIAEQTGHGIAQRVHPCMVPIGGNIAHVEGVFNAVVVQSDRADVTTYIGRGAGAGPTAAAVAADLVDIARGKRLPLFNVPAAQLADLPGAPMERRNGGYYIRLNVVDQPGVIADISAIMRDHAISLESLLQRGRDPGEIVPVVLTTHETDEAAMVEALARIGRLNVVVEKPCMIRIEFL